MVKTIYFVLCFVVLLILILVSSAACISEEPKPKEEFVIAKLISIGPPNGEFIQSAGLYEGELELENIETSETYSYFVCTYDWSWVKLESCYKFDPVEVQQNIDDHKFSAELSGCYVGTFEEISC